MEKAEPLFQAVYCGLLDRRIWAGKEVLQYLGQIASVWMGLMWCLVWPSGRGPEFPSVPSPLMPQQTTTFGLHHVLIQWHTEYLLIWSFFIVFSSWVLKLVHWPRLMQKRDSEGMSKLWRAHRLCLMQDGNCKSPRLYAHTAAFIWQDIESRSSPTFT